ncbi:MAG TPA: EAL domain-containing protein [Devosia sp.]|nr:EAL domain-containing protein [Devosia sp.]
MRSKVPNIVAAIGVVFAFLPVAAVDLLLDNYVRQRETAQMQRAVDNVGDRIEANADDAVSVLRQVLGSSAPLCTPGFIANVRSAMQASLDVKDVLVENTSGLQYCDAFGQQFAYSPLSDSLSVPGHTESASLVKLDHLDMPMLKVTQSLGAERQVSAFVPILSSSLDSLLSSLAPASMVRIALTNGTLVATLGDAAGYDGRKSDAAFIDAQSFAGEIPLRTEVAAPFDAVKASYSGLGVGLTVLACLLSAAVLVLLLQYVRRANLPAFSLEQAIAHGELKPYYQPVIDLRNGRLLGCEMLCRWEKKNGEIVSPGAFIDYAEQTGLAIPMTVSLMQQMRVDLSELCREMPEMKVSINLFEGHFRDTSIVEDVQAIFADSPVSLSQLVFEITERREIGNSAQAHAVIEGLHKLGAKLAMDDAGTGHSNLAYLQTLGVDIIKIDRIFVDMIKPDSKQVPVLDGLIALARDLGKSVVAEGVETEAQVRYLKARGVLQAQGYLFAPALKAKAFRELARALNAPSDRAGPIRSAA